MFACTIAFVSPRRAAHQWQIQRKRGRSVGLEPRSDVGAEKAKLSPARAAAEALVGVDAAPGEGVRGVVDVPLEVEALFVVTGSAEGASVARVVAAERGNVQEPPRRRIRTMLQPPAKSQTPSIAALAISPGLPGVSSSDIAQAARMIISRPKAPPRLTSTTAQTSPAIALASAEAGSRRGQSGGARTSGASARR